MEVADRAAALDGLRDPAIRGAIEKMHGIDISQIDPGALQFLADQSKAAGGRAFRQGDHAEAERLFSQALAATPGEATLMANRCAARLKTGDLAGALEDAEACVRAAPEWPKGRYRLGAALEALGLDERAAGAYGEGLGLDPSSSELRERAGAVKARLAERAASRTAQARLERRSLCLRLREARSLDRREGMLRQYRGSMTAPSWELADLDWRPTWLPSLRARRLDPQRVLADARAAGLARYLRAVADLAGPKHALRGVADGGKWTAYRLALGKALRERPEAASVGSGAPSVASGPGPATVLVLENGGGVLPLLVAGQLAELRGEDAPLEPESGSAGRLEAGGDAPQPSVYSVSKSQMLYRMARATLEENLGIPGASDVCLLDCALQNVRVAGSSLPWDGDGGADSAPEHGRVEKDGEGGTAAPGEMDGALEGGSGARALEGGEDAGPGPGEALSLPRPASLLVLDLLESDPLAAGLLPAIDRAAQGLLSPGARVLPARIRVFARLLEFSVGTRAGFDLSGLDSYRWYPQAQGMDLDANQHRVLSGAFEVCLLDLQGRLDRALKGARRSPGSEGMGVGGVEVPAGGSSGRTEAAEESGRAPVPTGGRPAEAASPFARGSVSPLPAFEREDTVSVPVSASGRWNAVAFWFEAEFGGSLPRNGGADEAPPTVVLRSRPGAPERIGQRGSAGAATLDAPTVITAASFDHAVQWLDGREVQAGETVELAIRQGAGEILFEELHRPPRRARHALAPSWHFDMVQDDARNAAYDAAITRAVRAELEGARGRGGGADGGADGGARPGRGAVGGGQAASTPLPPAHPVTVLDMGAGTGILSMMACRAGAGDVVAAEISAHMCDVGEEVTIANGFLGRILMLDRDVRRLNGPRAGPDGSPADMPRPADLAVFELFDCGLIGEGVFHALLAAKRKLVRTAPPARLVPARARVFAQPLSLSRLTVAPGTGVAVAQANRWRWRPEYEGVELGRRREDWTAVAQPLEVFRFEFEQVEANMVPQEKVLRFVAPGGRGEGAGMDAGSDCGDAGAGEPVVCNCIAMWFELELDSETTLSTSPYEPGKGLTWPQAITWIPEVTVRPGGELRVRASHDSYSIDFRLLDHEPGASQREGRGAPEPAGSPFHPVSRTPVPLCDPVWKATLDALKPANEALVRSLVQDPLEFRATAMAALELASRPTDLGVDPRSAAEFAAKMLG